MHKDFKTKAAVIRWINDNRDLTIVEIEVVGKYLRIHYVREQ